MWKQHGPLAPNVTAADTLLVGISSCEPPTQQWRSEKSPGSATPHPNYITGRLLKKKKRKKNL